VTRQEFLSLHEDECYFIWVENFVKRGNYGGEFLGYSMILIVVPVGFYGSFLF
jgi:hypothetical protein